MRKSPDTDGTCKYCPSPISSWNRSGMCTTCYEGHRDNDISTYGGGGCSKSTSWSLDLFGNLFRLHGDV